MNTAVAALDRNREPLARILPFACYIAFLALTPLLAQAWPDLDRRWLYALQIGSVVLALAMFSGHYVELRSGPRLKTIQWAASGAVGISIFFLWIHLDLPWATLGSSGSGFDPRDAAGEIDWALALVRLFGAAAIVPLMEELFWRSFVLRWIERPAFASLYPATVGLRALAISALVFGIEHNLWVAGAIAGFAYGWLYIRTCNLWAPIFAHALTNLLLGIWILATGNWRFW